MPQICFLSLFDNLLHICVMLGHFRDESEWWILPSGLALCKIIQARLVDCHVANQEIQDPSLYSSDTNVFWNS